MSAANCHECKRGHGPNEFHAGDCPKLTPPAPSAAITPWPSAESSVARPCGTCWRCGGTLYEYLTHHCCTTSVRMVQNVQVSGQDQRHESSAASPLNVFLDGWTVSTADPRIAYIVFGLRPGVKK